MSPVLAQRAVSEDPRWTRAVGDRQSAIKAKEKIGKWWSFDPGSEGQPRPLDLVDISDLQKRLPAHFSIPQRLNQRPSIRGPRP